MLRLTKARIPLVRAALLIVALSSLTARSFAAPAAADTLRVVALLPAEASHAGVAAARRGIALGTEEAARTAALFGLAVEVLPEQAATPEDAARLGRRLAERDVDAIVGGVDGETCDALSALAVERSVVFVGVGCEARDVPSSEPDACHRSVFYVRPGASTVSRARDRYARRVADGMASDADIVLWHHTLTRFGAAQLNERFRRRFGAEMNSDAWAGWMAIKLLTEAALRGRSTAGSGVARYLASPRTRFDGHKGEPLAFDGRTGELRQPLYVVRRSARGEVQGAVAAEVTADEVFGPATPATDRTSACAARAR